MKYFLDTEFIERGGRSPIDLLSIAIVAEDGREYYAENMHAPRQVASPWVKENVIPHLTPDPFRFLFYTDDETRRQTPLRRVDEIDHDIRAFCDPANYGKPRFWGYYCDYDWVILCQLFGTMMDLPAGWPKYCLDLKQFSVMIGDVAIPKTLRKETLPEHHALRDARWIKDGYDYLRGWIIGKGTTYADMELDRS